MLKSKTKNIDVVINKEFAKCKDFIANVMGYKTVVDTKLTISYDKYPTEGWADAKNREVAIVVPSLVNYPTLTDVAS